MSHCIRLCHRLLTSHTPNKYYNAQVLQLLWRHVPPCCICICTCNYIFVFIFVHVFIFVFIFVFE